jgi:hypothetical protein
VSTADQQMCSLEHSWSSSKIPCAMVAAFSLAPRASSDTDFAAHCSYQTVIDFVREFSSLATRCTDPAVAVTSSQVATVSVAVTHTAAERHTSLAAAKLARTATDKLVTVEQTVFIIGLVVAQYIVSVMVRSVALVITTMICEAPML